MRETFEERKKFLAKTRRIEVVFMLFWNDSLPEERVSYVIQAYVGHRGREIL